MPFIDWPPRAVDRRAGENEFSSSSPKKRLLPFSGELGKIKAGSLCSAERIYILALFCRTHLYTKLVLQNTQKSRWLYIIRHDNVRIIGQIRSSLCSSLFRPFQQPFLGVLPAGNVAIMKRWSSRLCAKSPHGQRPQPRRERRFTREVSPRAARRTRVMHSARPERGTSAPRRCARLPPTNPDHMPYFSERIHDYAVALAITPASCCLCGAQGLLAVAALCFAPCRHDPSPLQLLHLLCSLLERGRLWDTRNNRHRLPYCDVRAVFGECGSTGHDGCGPVVATMVPADTMNARTMSQGALWHVRAT